MAAIVDYYLAPISPFTYLGGERLAGLAQRFGATVKVRPIDLTKVFPATGGLPLKQRSPQRQAYRMAELRRWRQYLDIPLVLEPKFFPVNADPAALMIIAARTRGLNALALSQRILRACWAEERNVADRDTLIELVYEVGMEGKALAEHSDDPGITAEYQRETDAAIERGVFGVPTYGIDNDLFWGQDRLDFVERTLAHTGGR
jgi:2-hydroxychromene-2-carboxylate isomerase